jgi:hypothetical protein
MLQRLQAAIDNGDLQVINMHKDGDGPQILELFTRPGEKVLRELIGDLRLAGQQHIAFHEYQDSHGNRLFAGDANRSVSFQLAQIKIGIDKVLVSIVLYIDGIFLKEGIPIRPVYRENLAPRQQQTTLSHVSLDFAIRCCSPSWLGEGTIRLYRLEYIVYPIV